MSFFFKMTRFIVRFLGLICFFAFFASVSVLLSQKRRDIDEFVSLNYAKLVQSKNWTDDAEKEKLKQTSIVIKNVIFDDESVVTAETYKKLKTIIQCTNRDFRTIKYLRGNYWVVQNFVKASHGQVDCFEDVTFVTQGDFTFMENLETLVDKWRGPISVSLHAPGTDLAASVASIRYLKDCSPVKSLINQWISFHLFFHIDHIPNNIPAEYNFDSYDCSLGPPYSVSVQKTYKYQKKLLYPVNVGRNVARDASLTQYFLSLDIELYPIPRLGARFLNMLARNVSLVAEDRPQAFVVLPFEVEENETVPDDKTTLQNMLQAETAIPFHKFVCPVCHESPFHEEWLKQAETPYMEITGIGKRTGHWEPLFIATHSLPYLDERLSWDGMRDKMSQAYALCLLDYDFLILSNAFVTHYPGIKKLKNDASRDKIVVKQWKFLLDVVAKELDKLYGERSGCIL